MIRIAIINCDLGVRPVIINIPQQICRGTRDIGRGHIAYDGVEYDIVASHRIIDPYREVK